MSWSIVFSTAGILLGTFFGYILTVSYNHRRRINGLRKRCVPMPEGWSWVTGHLLVLQKYLDRLPPNAAVTSATREMCGELFPDTEMCLIDLWPFYPPHFIVFNPEAIIQVCNKDNLPKLAFMSRLMRQVTGGPDLLSMDGEEWKHCRSLFNPGFSTGAMSNNVPHIVDSMLVFRQKLIGMIGQGGDDSNYQRSPNALMTALKRILEWHSFWDPRILLHPLRPMVQAYHGYLIDTYIRKLLDRQYLEAKHAELAKGLDEDPKSIKSVTALALETYLRDTNPAPQKDGLDEGFAHMLASQIRLFLFAGTDSTSTVLVYLYHMLAKHPDALARLRKEHDEVFGPDPGDAADLLKEKPSLLSSCKFTLAFIKETLRLYSPAGTMRAGLPGGTITDLRGHAHPLDDIGIHVLHQALHVNPRIWPRPHEFLPERFLVGPGHELYPSPAAYRPFEQGPKNCLGLTLVHNELRIALILTCRDLTITDAYDELDVKTKNDVGALAKLKRQLLGAADRPRTVCGERAYQTDAPGGHPIDGYPCRVEWAAAEL
ncbi:hypothetical protein PG997_007120 [Apiospora hydei]|uniref:Cytochrome P450 n=1 Tax=Apiospora hydei TaxID=1337664 RepID=A0ABR1WSB1_9PEZI